jgi:hypothetical protein
MGRLPVSRSLPEGGVHAAAITKLPGRKNPCCNWFRGLPKIGEGELAAKSIAGGPLSRFGQTEGLISKEMNMNITLSIAPLISLIAGILILVMPRLLNYIVAIYLIVIGLLGLFGPGGFHMR